MEYCAPKSSASLIAVSTFANSASKSAIVAIYAARPDFVPLGALKG
jgi:hypothetical protein